MRVALRRCDDGALMDLVLVLDLLKLDAEARDQPVHHRDDRVAVLPGDVR